MASLERVNNVGVPEKRLSQDHIVPLNAAAHKVSAGLGRKESELVSGTPTAISDLMPEDRVHRSHCPVFELDRGGARQSTRQDTLAVRRVSWSGWAPWRGRSSSAVTSTPLTSMSLKASMKAEKTCPSAAAPARSSPEPPSPLPSATATTPRRRQPSPRPALPRRVRARGDDRGPAAAPRHPLMYRVRRRPQHPRHRRPPGDCVMSDEGNHVRLLPWTGSHGQQGTASRMAGRIERTQLGLAGRLLGRARAVLPDQRTDGGQWAPLAGQLTEALQDVLLIAESRGARLGGVLSIDASTGSPSPVPISPPHASPGATSVTRPTRGDCPRVPSTTWKRSPESSSPTPWNTVTATRSPSTVASPPPPL